MNELLFGPVALWFTIPALLGTVFFTLRLALMFVGGADSGLDGDVDVDLDTDIDVDTGDSDAAFKLLSVQSIAAFLMGFGWGGLGAYRGAGWSMIMTLGFAITAGAGMVWLLGKLLLTVYRLQSSGNISIDATLGLEGTVYAEVPAVGGGRGQVRLIVDDRERFYRAVTDGEMLGSRERVRVVRVNDDNSVTVERI